MQTPASRPPLSISGFLGAAASAPGLAVIVCMLGTLATTLVASGTLSGWGSALFGLIFFILIATIWGVLPSLVFGGLVLAVMQRMPWRRRPAAVEYTVGGLAAAGLYWLAGLGAAALSPGAALLLAPWSAPDVLGASGGEPWWVAASLLLAGAGAGRFYALCVKRG